MEAPAACKCCPSLDQWLVSRWRKRAFEAWQAGQISASEHLHESKPRKSLIGNVPASNDQSYARPSIQGPGEASARVMPLPPLRRRRRHAAAGIASSDRSCSSNLDACASRVAPNVLSKYASRISCKMVPRPRPDTPPPSILPPDAPAMSSASSTISSTYGAHHTACQPHPGQCCMCCREWNVPFNILKSGSC